MVLSLKKEFLELISENIREDILDVSKFAESINTEIFLIGGVVRDLIINNPIKDIDIVVQADAIDFCRLLATNLGCEIVSEQENLRTAKVAFKSGKIIDFASTREENYVASGVLPIACNFGCLLSKDVKRRDFTINTLAVKLTGNDKFALVDYFNGFDDIKNKKLRVLHDKSFIDDPSRIIRALKFKVRFDFEIEERTYDLMQSYLCDVSKTMPLERIKSELKQYFAINACNLYSLIIETNSYKLISDNPITDINQDNFKLISDFELFQKNDMWFIYVVLLIINSDFSLQRLNFNSTELKIIREVKELIAEKHSGSLTNKEIYNMFDELNNLSIAIYYLITGSKTVEKFLKALKEIEVLVTGKDLIDLGFIPSAYFSELFDKILEKKLNGELKTKKDEINFVKQFLKKTN